MADQLGQLATCISGSSYRRWFAAAKAKLLGT
jgi:hypothetical protein